MKHYFSKCDEWPQESGCPFLTAQLPSNSLVEEPVTAAVGRMAVRMRAHGIESENDDSSEHDSVDDMMRDQENDDSDSGNNIYHDRFRRHQQQQDIESEGDY